MYCQTYCRADILLLLKHQSPAFPSLITIHSFIPLLQSAPGCYCNPLFHMAITTVQTNSAIDQNSWAKTAQAPLSYPEHCSQSTKLQSCAYLCPTYQLGAHKKIYFQIPRLRKSLLYSKAKSTTMPHHHRYTQDITVRQWARDGVIWRQHFFIWL